jgi:maleylpyruvate isomerase
VKLYGYWRSSCTWRVRIGLLLKKLPFEYVPVHLVRDGGDQHRAEHRARNPLGQVPVLEIAGEAEPVYITQSLAILEYLEDEHPDPALLPGDALSRVRVRELAEIVNSGIQPLQNTAVMRELQRVAPGVEARAWCAQFIERGLIALEGRVSRTAGRFLVGDVPTLADVCLVPQLYNARRFGVDLEPFATLRRVEAACATIEAFENAHPDRQPDAESTP